MLKYQDYYRHYGVRRAMQMVAPTLTPIQKLQLPQQSILHDLPEGGQVGISSDDYLLRNVTGPIYADHVVALTETRGNPRHSMISVQKLIREYHRKYRKIRQLHELDRVLADKRSIIIENYGFLGQLWRYPANLYRPYNKWFNTAATLWERIGHIANESQRPQFIECRLPSILPSKTMLNKAAGPVTTRLLSMFPDQESLFILELWKWLGDTHRADALISKVPADKLDLVNLIWMESDRWFVLNLGLLNSWRLPTETEIKAGAKAVKGAIPWNSLQNRFLRLLMFLHESRTAQGGEAKPLTEDEKIAQAGHDAAHETPVDVSHEEKAATIEVPLGEDGKDEEIELSPDMDFGKLPIDTVEETPENNAKLDALIERDLSALDHLHMERALVDEEAIEEGTGAASPPELHTADEAMLDIPALKDISLKEGVMAKANQLADQGLLSAAEYRRLEKVADAYTKLPNPFGGAGTLAEAVVIDKDALTLTATQLAPAIGGVFDTSMLHSTLAEFEPKYIKEVLHKDVGSAVLHVQKAGIAVTDYQIKEVRDAMNHYEAHAVQLTPVRGKVSTFRFRLPKIREDGTFLANGSKYRMAKQRVDIPIRKTKSGEVALTSYYAKVFISRSEKKVANYHDWIINQVRARGMDTQDTTVTAMMLGDVFDGNYRVPRIYSILAQAFRSFTVEDLHLFFDYEVRHTLLAPELQKKLERKGLVVVGTWGEHKAPVLVGADNVFYKVELEKNEINLKVMGTLEDLLGLEAAKAPKEVAEIRILGKFIPVGLFLAYELGFEGLLKLLHARPVRRVGQGEQLKLHADEFAIAFEDERLVFHRGSDKAALILQGMATLNEVLAHYPQHLFEKKAIYFNVLDRLGLGVRYLREMDLLVDMFIDPITKEVLQELNDPLTFVGLVLKACDLLTSDWAPDETDVDYQRFRGYERLAGAVYQELVRAVRLQRSRGTSNAAIDINPYAVWQAITQDSSVRLVEESNPVHELKGQEEVTYAGTGGRSGRSMVGRTRIFHTNDMGIISESTKDSSDVAITTFLTANPHLTNLRGLPGKYHPATSGATSLLSTSALLAPFADRDEARRVNFISIQNSSTTFCKGQRASPIRTGYERVLSHRTSDLFAYTAKQEGVVSKVTKGAIEITYKDGSIKTVELGKRFGTTSDLKIPHVVVTPLKEGDRVQPGEIISYNALYFELDPLDKTQVLWKQGVLLRTALMECPETLEDSSLISQRAAELLETKMSKARDLVVESKQTIHNLVRVGDRVEVDSILCTIEDPITADQHLFDEKSRQTLKLLAANSPKAKMAGIVEKVECFYHADIDELSPSLQELASECDMERKRKARELRVPYATGRVDDSLRIDGNPLLADHVDIRITITADVGASSGDKGVFGNQLKTIFSRVMVGRNETEDGEPIDAVFSYHGVNSRIVLSPELMGTTTTLLKVLSKKAAAIYTGS